MNEFERVIELLDKIEKQIFEMKETIKERGVDRIKVINDSVYVFTDKNIYKFGPDQDEEIEIGRCD
jgi:hypothetical protein